MLNKVQLIKTVLFLDWPLRSNLEAHLSYGGRGGGLVAEFVARQIPLSMGFPRQESWSRLPFPSPGDLPDLGIEPESPALAGGFSTTKPSGKPLQRNARMLKSL